MKSVKLIAVGRVSKDVIVSVARELRSTYNLAVKILPPKNIPEDAFNPSRQQYLATNILNFLANFGKNVLGIFEKDLYAEGLNFVFGQAQVGGNAVVSIARLLPSFYHEKADKEKLISRVVKEAIHEVGHVLGITHCLDPSCVMCFSNSILDVDKKSKNLCPRCRRECKN